MFFGLFMPTIADITQRLAIGLVNDGVEGRGKMRSLPNLKYYTSIYLEGLSRNTKNLSLDNGHRIEIWTIERPSASQTTGL
jgi:hypothetical protein